MQIIPKPNQDLPEFPLPIYSAINIAEAVSRDEEKFSVFVGLDEKMVEQLKKLSGDLSDEDLQKNTSDLKRFGLGSYENWYNKNRTPFALIHNNTNALAALIWFGPKQLGRKSMKHLSDEELKNETNQDAENWYTISYRCYPNFRGKGLMKRFGNFVTDVYMKKFPGIKLWASASEKNTAGVAFAISL